MAKRRKHNLGRDSKGRFLKRRTPKRRRRNVVRRRRTRRSAPKIRRVRRVRHNVVKRHNRKRRVTKMAAKRVHRRRRRHNAVTVHHRRRRYTKASNPRRRHRRVRHNRRHRRNAGMMSGLIGRVDFKSVAFVAAGVFLGDKISGILTDKVMTYIGGVTGTSDTTRGFVKLALGVVASGLIWKFQPALGLGVAVGAIVGVGVGVVGFI